MFKFTHAVLLFLFSLPGWALTLNDAVEYIEGHIASELRQKYATSYLDHRTETRIPRSLAALSCKDFNVLVPESGVLGRASWPVTCNDTIGVRSRIITNTDVQINVPILTRTVSRGELVHMDDWEMRPDFISRDTGYLLHVDSSYLATRHLRAERPVKAIHLEQVKVVNQGDIVTLKMNGPGVIVEVEVEAESSADVGQRVQVRSLSSGKAMSAIVESKGVVLHSKR